MRILFITYNDIESMRTGGSQCSERNYNLLKECGKVECITIQKESSVKSALSLFHLYFPPLSRRNVREIIQRVKNAEYNIVFLDSSLFGTLAHKIRKINSKINIIVFFHNVEVDYIDVRIKNRIKNIIYKKVAKRNESLSTIYADKLIALNERDKNRIYDIYNRAIDFILPITFRDTYKRKQTERNKSKYKIGLFVGALGNANYDSLKWFLNNSKMLSQFEFQVIGKNFERVAEELSDYEVNVIGTVDDIAEYYENADFVISPIQYGGGMKVKIAEALMYGKLVLGTKEAFEGYHDETNQALILCNSVEEFDKEIRKIIEADSSKYNNESRKLYEMKYSNKVYVDRFKEFIYGGKN